MKNLKMIWLPGLCPGTQWGSLQHSPSSPRPPCWNKLYFIWNSYRNALGKAIL